MGGARRIKTRLAEPSYKYGRDIQPHYFTSSHFVINFISDIDELINTYKNERQTSELDTFSLFMKCYTRLRWRNVHFIHLHAHIRIGFYQSIFRLLFELFKERKEDIDSITTILLFSYVIYSTQPDDEQLFRTTHIQIEVDTLDVVYQTLNQLDDADLLKWAINQLKFSIHPSQSLLPRIIPSSEVKRVIPTTERSEQVIEKLLDTHARLYSLEKRLDLVKQGKFDEIMLGEQLLESDITEFAQIEGISQFNLSNEDDIDKLRRVRASTINKLVDIESEAHNLGLDSMKSLNL
ncbi:hypothetical protein E3Q18_01016 [Wallemia mellicola]|nr:hypothetical protein E3Q18_01016 [Wallemia mellicola]